MQSLTILGSTGFIGRSTLSVIQQYYNKFSVYALVANTNVAVMTKQCLQVHPKYVCMLCSDSAKALKNNLVSSGKCNTKVLSGIMHACELASSSDVDIVMSAMVGIFGLKPTFSALRSGKKILLANKEILVACGKLFMEEAYRYHSTILPIDSEHNAIFQSLPELCQKNLGRFPLSKYGVTRIVLTASGGAFLNLPREKLSLVTPEEACLHPNWSMGPKTSVDSATMMNKGLEYIEARYLFCANPENIEILLHPQSIVHSMVCYSDGTILAHLAPPDMKIPIAYAMTYPNRMDLKNSFNLKLDVFNSLHFSKLNICNYPCLKLAIDASNSSQTATIILNAANEVAVECFLNRKISFNNIPNLIDCVLNEINLDNPKDIEEVLYIDKKAREKAMSICVV